MMMMMMMITGVINLPTLPNSTTSGYNESGKPMFANPKFLMLGAVSKQASKQAGDNFY
jgi:hypothetical protein